jgi:hypothetical protein
MLYRIVSLIVIFFLSTGMISENESHSSERFAPKMELLYDNVWGTIYNAVSEQCDSTPTITGDGSRINPYHASQHRWIAISQEMINSAYRASLLMYPDRDMRFKGKIQYGDTVWIESPYDEINGWWVVRDAKNAMYNNSIDFLQTQGDGSLYNNDKYWSGKFENIRIFRVDNYKYSALQKSI